MARKRKRIASPERRLQILRVARRLFSRQGFRGTTTRQIAEQAQVNEAIIFRHFRHKDDIYWAVLDEISRARKGRLELEATVEGSTRLTGKRATDDEKIFTALAEGILRRSRQNPELGRLLLFSALERHSLSQRFFRTYIAAYWEVLANYIRARMRAGDFRQMNPLIAASSFVGMVSQYHMMQDLFGARKYYHHNDRLVCRTIVQIWLGGVLAKQSSRRSQE